MWAYAGPFLILASVPGFYYGLGPAGPFASIALLLAFLIGAEYVSPRGAVPSVESSRRFRLLPAIYVPFQLAETVWAIGQTPQVPVIGYIALLLATGVATGVFGILAAHELVHSRTKLGHIIGTAMLTGMCYRHFRIAHIYGHHRYAGTARDSATARLGESFYAFLVRTVAGQMAEAWRHEQLRLAKRHFRSSTNRVNRDGAVMLVIFITIFIWVGWRSVLFFASESAVGVVVLELFNYIAHYGLVRGPRTNGMLEPFGDHHSWNSSNVLANMMIFNMGRHSDHHRRPSISYEGLRYSSRAPELPAGYAGSILMALVPPLWRRVMDPTVESVMKQAQLPSAVSAS